MLTSEKPLTYYTDTELDALKEKIKEITKQIIEIEEERRKNKKAELIKNFEKAFNDLRKEGIEISVYRKLSEGLIDNIDFDEFSFDDSEE